MSKKNVRKERVPEAIASQQPSVVETAFGYDEMLTELEAIVADAQIRLAEEDEAA